MKQPAKTLIFAMVSMALIACETPQKTESVVILDPVPKEQIKKAGQPSIKVKSDQEGKANTPAYDAQLIDNRLGKTKDALEEQDASLSQPGVLQVMPQSVLASRIITIATIEADGTPATPMLVSSATTTTKNCCEMVRSTPNAWQIKIAATHS